MPIINTIIAGGGSSPVIDPLNVTPSTSAQTITASGGVDGYSPVNVSAVTSSIDANITSANIKSGVSILGVAGSVTELNGSTETVTPTTSQQTVTPTSPSNGLTSVTVNAVTNAIDANITAGNIKKDVSILGVTGTYEGTTPTGTKSITANGIYDVTNFASADVQVPTTAPALYREFQLDGTGKLIPNKTTTHIMDFTGVTDVSEYALYGAYNGNTAISGAVDMSDLITISGTGGCNFMFYSCTGLTSADLSALTTISGGGGCSYMFQSCTRLTSVDLSSLTTISGNSGCNSMFQGCTRLTSADLSALTTISGSNACGLMFYGCTSLTTVYLGGTTAIDFGTRTNQFTSMFSGCTQNIDVYAPAANQTQIESFSGYPNFGAVGTVTWHWRS